MCSKCVKLRVRLCDLGIPRPEPHGQMCVGRSKQRSRGMAFSIIGIDLVEHAIRAATRKYEERRAVEVYEVVLRQSPSIPSAGVLAIFPSHDFRLQVLQSGRLIGRWMHGAGIVELFEPPQSQSRHLSNDIDVSVRSFLQRP